VNWKDSRLKRQELADIRRAEMARSHGRDNDSMNRATGVVGKFASGQKNFSRDHDRELADAFQSS